MSSRVRKAYVVAKFYELGHRWARARHSEAAAARSSALQCVSDSTHSDERELIPTDVVRPLGYCCGAGKSLLKISATARH